MTCIVNALSCGSLFLTEVSRAGVLSLDICLIVSNARSLTNNRQKLKEIRRISYLGNQMATIEFQKAKEMSPFF